jgi:hypothetical protein
LLTAQACWKSIVEFHNNVGEGKTGNNAPITNWVYWLWNPESVGAPPKQPSVLLRRRRLPAAQPAPARSAQLRTPPRAAPRHVYLQFRKQPC